MNLFKSFRKQLQFTITLASVRPLCVTKLPEHVLHGLCFNLKINVDHAKYLALKYPMVKRLSNSDLEKIYNTLYQLGFKENALLEEPGLFSVLPITIKYRWQVLKESGFHDITPNFIASYLSIVKQNTIGELKKKGWIHSNINIENRLAGFLTQWPTSITNKIYGDINTLSLYELRIKIIKNYLELILDLKEDEFKRCLTTYPTIKHRPLAAINETINILQNELMLPVNKIRSNFYLIHADPQNLKDIMYKVKSIAGFDVREIMRLFPRVAMKNYQSILEISKIMKEYDISDEALSKCIEIYSLGPDTIRDRLQKAKQLPEFQALFSHPRFLKIIYHNNTAINRLQNLYNANKKCLSLHILTGGSARYQRFEKSPGDRNGKGSDLLFCIKDSLGKQYSTSSVRKLIKRHPYWVNVPLVQIKHVIENLLKHFTVEEIYENCAIVLYPWNKIKHVLKIISNEDIDSDFIYENLNFNKLSNKQKLSLALYLLEKEYYFSGNGIWNEDKHKSVSVDPVSR